MNLSSLKTLGRQYLRPFANSADKTQAASAPDEGLGGEGALVDNASPSPLRDRAAQLSSGLADTINSLPASAVGNRALNLLRGTMARFDDRYQQWMEDHVDPFLSGNRSKQADTLHSENESASIILPEEAVIGVRLDGVDATSIVEQKREINRSIGLSVALAAFAAGANLLALPAALIGLPLGLYITAPTLRTAYNDVKVKRKIGDPAVLP